MRMYTEIMDVGACCALTLGRLERGYEDPNRNAHGQACAGVVVRARRAEPPGWNTAP